MIEAADSERGNAPLRCVCEHCGARLVRSPCSLADFLDGAVPFLARHSACAPPLDVTGRFEIVRGGRS